MKEIGETLKETRENMGLSIEEVSTDLKLRPIQIENIESGNVESFKDVFYLKSLIREYSKYLGLDHDDMVDEFNEYLFDHTSRISMDDIKKAKKKTMKKEKKVNRVASPYTLDKKRGTISKIIVGIILVAILCVSLIFIFNRNDNKDIPKDDKKIIGG